MKNIKSILLGGLLFTATSIRYACAGLVGADVNVPENNPTYYDLNINRANTAYAYQLFNQQQLGVDPSAYWDNMMEQYESSQLDFIAVWMKGDGQYTGQPARFQELVAAVNKRELTNRLKLMPFDDNPASWCAQWNFDNGRGYGYAEPFDLSNQANWAYVWNKDLEVWFQNVPDANRLKINGRPVISFWSLSPTFVANAQGNASKLITYIRQQCQAEFGFNPYIIVPEEWPINDTTSQASGIIDAVRPWFVPVPNSPAYSTWNLTNPSLRYNGVIMGCAVPSYMGLPNLIDPNHGSTLATGMENTVSQSTLTFLEGFDDYWEATTLYRAQNIDPVSGAQEPYSSNGAYDYPNQRINIVREYGNVPFPTNLKEEAEGCDYFGGGVGRTDIPNYYRNGQISVYPCTDTFGGYYVGAFQASQWLEWEQVPIQNTVRLVARVATANANGQLHFVIDGKAEPTIDLPYTGGLGTFATVDGGVYTFPAGSYHTVRIVSDTAGCNLNYWQLADPTVPIPPVIPPSEIAFSDYFDTGSASNWTTYGGTWTATPDEYGVTSGPGYKSIASGTDFSDFTLETDIKITPTTGNSGLIFRVQDPTVGTDAYQGYYAGINASGVIFGRANNGWTGLQIVNASLAGNTFHHMKIVCLGSMITIYVDDMTTPKIRATDSMYTRGAIGLRTFQQVATYANVIVSNATIPDSVTFSDNFTNGSAADWTSYGGTWTISNGDYGVNTGPGYKSIANGTTFSDFTYEADMSVAAGNGNAGLIFRVSNPSVGTDSYQGYYAGISTDGITFGRANNGWTGLLSKSISLAANTVHHMKVVCSGATILIYVDNMTTPQISASDTTYTSGAIGLRAFNLATVYDNIVVSDAATPAP